MTLDQSNILFLTTSVEDYLADGILLGLRKLYAEKVVDFPKKEILYRDVATASMRKVRGQGFTLYTGLLENVDIDRHDILSRIQSNKFQIIVISDIWRQFGWLYQHLPFIKKSKVIVLDGADMTDIYPSNWHFWRHASLWFAPRVVLRFPYFKREWTADSRRGLARCLPSALRKILGSTQGLSEISFCIPDEKIIREPIKKLKDFPLHIVDTEVAAKVSGSSVDYAFQNEAEYYHDLQISRFGITTRRAGWDCLRHYEIAMNGAVPCFRDLIAKPVTCAPHGLNKNNCLIYTNWSDLQSQIKLLDETSYEKLQQNALKWVKECTTTKVARRMLLQAGCN